MDASHVRVIPALASVGGPPSLPYHTQQRDTGTCGHAVWCVCVVCAWVCARVHVGLNCMMCGVCWCVWYVRCACACVYFDWSNWPGFADRWSNQRWSTGQIKGGQLVKSRVVN
jgi:hypothetical protein